jgi:hypothetical protein
MTQALSGAAIAAVIAVCWLLGRPRPKILRSTDTSAVAALNRGQMELVLEAAAGAATATAATDPHAEPGSGAPALADGGTPSWPREQRQRGLLLRQLEQQFLAGGEPRRQAMALCGAWNHRDTLPLIRRGLRDSDPSVVGLAAEAMAAFRGRSTAGASAQPTARPPRNVSRTR